MSDHFTLFVDKSAWRGGVVRDGVARIEAIPFAASAPLAERAAAARKALADMGHADQPLVVALPSSWCLCATISTNDLDRGGRRRALGFRLEEHLPIAAEEVVADYVETVSGEALGVCGELARLSAMVAALESAGLQVRHICPAALLAAAHVADGHAEVHAVLDRRGDQATTSADSEAAGESGPSSSDAGYDLIELHRGKPTRWWWLADDVGAVRERLAAWAATRQQPARLATVGQDEAALHLDQALQGIEHVPVNDVTDDQAAALAAARILHGSVSPWIDLRRDALGAPDQYKVYRKPLAALIAAGVLLLIGIVIVTQWRGRQYEAMAVRIADQQVEVFKSTMANQRPPASIKGRLQSERQKLAGLGGQAAGGKAGALAAPSALEQLRTVFAGLPADVRFRILDLTIQPDLIRIDGQARSHAEAERVAVALRQAGLQEVESPKTQAMSEGGVSFLFTAKPRAATATAGAPAGAAGGATSAGTAAAAPKGGP